MDLKNLVSSLLGLLATFVYAEAEAPAQYNDNPPYNFHGEIDNTDTYAIPLDSSEEDQEEAGERGLCAAEGRRAHVVRQLRHPQGCEEHRQCPHLHQLHDEA